MANSSFARIGAECLYPLLRPLLSFNPATSFSQQTAELPAQVGVVAEGDAGGGYL